MQLAHCRLKMSVALLVFLSTVTVPVSGNPLAASVEATVLGNSWSYVVTNEELAGSGSWISSFLLNIGAPVVRIESPVGWAFHTDYLTYVLWFNADIDPPYGNDLPPGGSLNGFVLEADNAVSTRAQYDLNAWDHLLDEPGTSAAGMTEAPFSEPVPEPSTTVLVVCGLLSLASKLTSRR